MVVGIGRSGAKPGGIRAAIVLLVLIPVLVPLFAAALIWLGEREVASAATDKVRAAATLASSNVRLLVESTLEKLRLQDEQLGRDPKRFTARALNFANGFGGLYDAEGFQITANGERQVNIASNAGGC